MWDRRFRLSTDFPRACSPRSETGNKENARPALTKAGQALELLIRGL